MRNRCWRDLARLDYGEAFELQLALVERRKRGEIADQLLIVEHPHTITLGRNGHMENLVASDAELARAGRGFHHTDRGGDIPYHASSPIGGSAILRVRDRT